MQQSGHQSVQIGSLVMAQDQVGGVHPVLAQDRVELADLAVAQGGGGPRQCELRSGVCAFRVQIQV